MVLPEGHAIQTPQQNEEIVWKEPHEPQQKYLKVLNVEEDRNHRHKDMMQAGKQL